MAIPASGEQGKVRFVIQSDSISSEKAIPAPGEAPMPAADAAALIRRNGTAPEFARRSALAFGDESWTYAEFLAESERFANLFRSRLTARAEDKKRGVHVGVLLDNTPEYLFAFGGAALAGAAIVGLNHTRREQHLLRDIQHSDCDLLVTEPKHLALLDSISGELPEVLVSHRYPSADEVVAAHSVVSIDLDEALAITKPEPDSKPNSEPDPDSLWALIFTSGTSDAPKAVICSQRRFLVTGTRMGIMMGLGPDDVGYICMPLFHSNALMVGWAPALVVGASVGLARKFSASGWLPDVRKFGSTYFNYTGKPLAYLLSTPAAPDDADNTMRVAFGNEGSPEVVNAFARRFGVDVIDAYGATEGGIAVNSDREERPGALGHVEDFIKVVDEAGDPLPRAQFDENGRLVNAEECVGEIVNTNGAGPFEGYYNNDEANERTLRFGWYWTGDLGYLDDDSYLYFAGRNADWLRVDGENFPTQPIETALSHHPDVVLAPVYGVPDAQAGDQVMTGLVLRAEALFDAEKFGDWLLTLDEIGPKWRPRYLRVLADPPTTGTNKIVKRTLVHQKWRADRVGTDPVFVWDGSRYELFTAEAEATLRRSFISNQREQFWDL